MLVNGIPRNTSGTSNSKTKINVTNDNDYETDYNSEEDLYEHLEADEYRVR